MPKILIYEVKKENLVRNILKNEFNMSERFIRKLKRDARIKCNDKAIYLDYRATKNDVITIDIQFDEVSKDIVAENIPLDILYEDEYLIVINKPANMVVHPTCLHRSHTLANAVQYYLENKKEKVKIRFVNRLDRDTTGVVIFAKSEYIQECLVKQMNENIIKKEYIAIVNGYLEETNGTISFPIKRDDSSIMLRKIAPDGEKAITHFEVLKKLKNNMTIVKYILETGRTHQIRVHSKAIGHSIVGDDLYGEKSILIDRQALHAYRISFNHPISKQRLTFTANIPIDIMSIINKN